MASGKPYMLYTWVGRWGGRWEPFYLAMSWDDLLSAVRRYRSEFPDWKLQAR